MDIGKLNKKYESLTPQQRVAELYNDFGKVLLTSSFGTTSVLLLHMFSKVRPGQVVHFLNTTYHFQETLEYREKVKNLFGLTVIEVQPEEWKNAFTQTDQTWTKDSDLCCSINKVEPLDRIKPGYEIWVSGLMAAQNEHRKKLGVFEDKGDIIKFYPLIDVTQEEADRYIEEHGLPQHPLKSAGFSSVGCVHCTVRGRGREGRWANRSKTECGLHL